MKYSIRCKSLRAFLLCIFAVVIFGTTSAASASEFKQVWSGWFVRNSEAGLVDGVGEGGDVTFSGRGTFGRADNHAVTDVLFTGAPCDIDPTTGEPIGFTILVRAHTNILVTRNGDQLFRMLSSEPGSILCFDIFTQTANLTAYLDIVGGTGRFEGATGSTVLKTKIVFVGRQNSVTGTEEGQIYGVSSADDEDED